MVNEWGEGFRFARGGTGVFGLWARGIDWIGMFGLGDFRRKYGSALPTVSSHTCTIPNTFDCVVHST